LSTPSPFSYLFFFNATATPEIYTLSLHDALPILVVDQRAQRLLVGRVDPQRLLVGLGGLGLAAALLRLHLGERDVGLHALLLGGDRKSTRLNPVTDQSRMPSSA